MKPAAPGFRCAVRDSSSDSVLVTRAGCACQDVIKRRYGLDATNVGDEGGFAPNIQVEQQPTRLTFQHSFERARGRS